MSAIRGLSIKTYFLITKNARIGSRAIEQWTEIHFHGLDMRGKQI